MDAQRMDGGGSRAADERGEAVRLLQEGRLQEGLIRMEAALDLDPREVQTVLLARQVEQQLGPDYRDAREKHILELIRQAWATPRRGHQLLKAASFQNAPRLMEELARMAAREPEAAAARAGAMPLVTVVVPVFNGVGRMEQGLASVAGQSWPNLQIVLVDDGSTDTTLGELQRFRVAHREREIEVLALGANGGQANARNRGAERARGDFLLFHDCDDLLAAGAVWSMVEALQRAPEAGWASPLTVQRGDVNRLFGFERPDLRILLHRNQFTICGLLRTGVFRDLGGFHGPMRHGLEDWEFWLRAMASGYRPVQLAELGLVYHRHGDSTTGRLQASRARRERAKLDIVANNPRLYRQPGPEERERFGAEDAFSPALIRESGVQESLEALNPLARSSPDRVPAPERGEEHGDPAGANTPARSLAGQTAPSPDPAQSEATASAAEREPAARAEGRLRLLFVCHDYPPHRIAGAQLYAHHLAKALQGLGHEVHVFYARYLSTLDPGRRPGELLEGRYDGVPVREVVVDDSDPALNRHPQHAFENPATERAFEELLERGGYDLVHVHLLFRLSARLPEIARRRGVPTVATLHDYWLPCALGHMVDTRGRECSGPESPAKCARCLAGFREPEPRPDLLAFFQARQRATQGAFQAFDLVLSPSAFLADVHERYGFGRPRVLPLGWLPLEGVEPHPQGEKIQFGFCGQVVFRKGVDVMLSAFAALPPGGWELHIHGKVQDEGYFEQLRPVIEAHPDIHYHGAYSSGDLPAIYSTLDVALMPSRRENYPLTLLESLSAGVPAIAADVGGVREILGEEGEGGFVFPNGDAKALAAILRRLLADPDLLRRVRANLKPPKTIAENGVEMEQIYRSLLGGGLPPAAREEEGGRRREQLSAAGEGGLNGGARQESASGSARARTGGLVVEGETLRVHIQPEGEEISLSLEEKSVEELADRLKEEEVRALAVPADRELALKVGSLLAREGVPVVVPKQSAVPAAAAADSAGAAPHLPDPKELAAAVEPYREGGEEGEVELGPSDLAALPLPEDHQPRPDLMGPKLLSTRFKFLWVGVPKVATRSLLQLFMEDPPMAFGIRPLKRPLDEVMEVLAGRGIFTFSFVRNPWGRVVSCWRNKIARWHPSTQTSILNDHPRLRTGMSFEAFVEYLVEDPGGRDEGANRHWMSQHRFLCDSRGELRMDEVGKLETLREDFERIRLRLGIPELELPWWNHSRLGWHLSERKKREAETGLRERVYRRFYTPRTREMIAHRYARDIELFGYDF